MIVVFDLDGTLIDSARDIATSASELVTSLGGRPLAVGQVATMIGDGASVLVKRALREGGLDPDTPDALARFLDIYNHRLLETTVAYPGIRETLSLLLPRARLAVLTNKPQAHAERVLEGLGLASYFERIIGGDTPWGKKPEGRGMLELAATVPPSGTVLVGDSPVDYATACAAGSAFVWARYGFGASRFDGAAPDTPYVLERPIDLVPVIDRLNGIFGGT